MIKLRDILSEDFYGKFGVKNKWIQLKKSDRDELSDEILKLITISYSQKGGNHEFRSIADIKKSDLNFWVDIDIDDDPNSDSVLGGKTTNAGTKITVMGTDGNSSSKKTGILKMIDFMKRRGFYAELDPDLAQKFGLSHETDERVIRKVLNKDIKMNSDGSYQRKLTGGPIKTKVLVGIPKI